MSTSDPFNSPGGFSVGIPPELVIDANGNIVTNVNAPEANVTANRIFANSYLYANGQPLSIGASGSNTQVQYNSSGNLAGSANLTFDGTTLTAAAIADSSLTSGRVTYAGASGNLTDSANLTFDGSNLQIGAQGDLRFADSDSSNWVAFQGPATVASNVTWTLPSVDGTSGQALTTNGLGTLSFSTITSGVSKGQSIAFAMIFGL